VASLRVCVCVKVVPQAAQPEVDPLSFRIDRAGPVEINPPDLYAVEEALLIRDRVGAEVIAVSMGPEHGVESLRAVLAMGVDRAVMVSDDSLVGSDLVVTSRVLGRALAVEAPDVVLFGSEATDGGGAMLWSAVAERLAWPVVSGAQSVEVTGSTARVERRSWGDRITVEAPMPLVIAMSEATTTPRYPTLRDVMAARRKEVTVVTAGQLGLPPEGCGAAGARTSVLRIETLPNREASPIVQDDGHAAEWLFDLLAQRGFV
jgi:electron transfer flavoprotein beta subunit